MKWTEYPAGAHLITFDEMVRVEICFNKCKGTWEALLFPPKPFYGIKVLGYSHDKKQLMKRVEKWAKKQAEKILSA